MPTQSTGARRAHSRGEHMLGPGIFLLTTPPIKSTHLPKAQAPAKHAHAESTCWGQDYFTNRPIYKSTGARRAHPRGEHMLGPGIFLLTTPNKSTRLPKVHAPGEHTHAESTCWGQNFFYRPKSFSCHLILILISSKCRLRSTPRSRSKVDIAKCEF